ncbi:MAG: 16S rRNA (cytosine(1402)-N(4))-methyltransferase RsmH [Maricaulaceae bacterium]
MAGHAPVMLAEVVDALAPAPGEAHLDATFGGGGYARALLAAAPCRVVGLDRDPVAAARAQDFKAEFGDRFDFAAGPFSDLEGVAERLGLDGVDGVVFDLGVSSFQLDEAERGFSFRHDGPLDMRMSGDGLSAAEAVNHMSSGDLSAVFRVYGEERKARRAAAAIVHARAEAPITSTARLADIVAKAVGTGGEPIHPATRVFQALRILVNDELGQLARGLQAAERVLRPGGRLVAVSFHSLEDRVVKRFLRRRANPPSAPSRHMPVLEGPLVEPSFTLPFSGVREPSAAEVVRNPRARSAKLRVGVRTVAPVAAEDFDLAPRAPSIALLGAA